MRIEPFHIQAMREPLLAVSIISFGFDYCDCAGLLVILRFSRANQGGAELMIGAEEVKRWLI
jgi:hypothetical protein